MTYKWTIADVDKLTFPFAKVMLRRIEERPGADVAAEMQFKQAKKDFDRKQREAFDALPAKKRPKSGEKHG